MVYKLTFLLVAAFLIPASFSAQDDAILAFTKQAAEDLPVYKASFDKKTEVMSVLNELKDKADQLLRKRQAHQNDLALETSVQALAGKLLHLAVDYFVAETKALEAAKNHLHLVEEMENYLKKGP